MNENQAHWYVVHCATCSIASEGFASMARAEMEVTEMIRTHKTHYTAFEAQLLTDEHAMKMARFDVKI